MKLRLTKAKAATLGLPEGKRDAIHWDTEIPGFGLRFRQGAQGIIATWVLQHKSGRETLGRYPAIKPEAAREWATKEYAQIALGHSPAAAREKAKRQQAETLEPALHLYMAQKKLRPRSRVEIDRHLFKNCAPLHRMPLTAITRADVAKMLEAVTEQSGEIQANRTRASLSAFFVWAWRRGMVENNPVLATHRHSEVSRDRVLSDPEIRRIWHALPESDFGRALRVLLLTGQRRREIAHLRWSEVDLARGVIELPAERTKNGRAHQVPITAPVRSILEAQPRSGDQVFAPANWEVRKAELDAALPLEPHWVVHDLRRTCATRMADLGIQPHVIEAVLNHMRGHRSGVAGVYNRALYATEKAQALARWAEHVTALVEGRPAAVVQLKQA
jgi:integrase